MTALPTTLEEARARDARDPLRTSRDQFHIPADTIYLDGNSLGCMPKATAARLRQVVEQEWAEGLIRSWNDADWINLPQRVGARIAPLIGAEPDEVLMTDSTSINLYKLAAAAVRMQPGRRRIITEPGNFPTDRYILQGLADSLQEQPELVTLPAEQIADAIDEDTALVMLTHVHYKSGRLHDMAAITQQARACGALMLWDLSHSAGALPVDLNGCGADMAVGCGYKYLNGGPGAPAFAWVAKRHHERLNQPIWGWFGHASPFAMSDDYVPAEGLRQVLTGTTAVLGASALETGLVLFADIDMAVLRRKSQQLTQQFIEAVERRCPKAGFELASPRDPEMRGSQVSFHHPEGYAIMQALIDRGVIGDFRAPDIIRFGMAPLYVGFEDIHNAVEILGDIMDYRHWDDPRYRQRNAVT
ncbi:kynureninase [Natronospirillum operosum]|uniref:kynureninase n=1 Tax=Natronospirillum operosum TaxID=2759953 RepID=UPI001F0F9061|nr:kynureninase [Natronospirillum operosum]